MGKKKYSTEEERKAAEREYQREYQKRWREKNKEKMAEYKAEWYQKNKKKRTEYFSNYYQKNKEKILEHQADYYQKNKEKIAAYCQKNKEKRAEYQTKYKSTPYGRALYLYEAYKREDKNGNRGECTLTPQWIVDNVFSGQVCHYCGETDWRKIGCDRKDSSLPHTPENCVPCCASCNSRKWKTPYDEFMRMMSMKQNEIY